MVFRSRTESWRALRPALPTVEDRNEHLERGRVKLKAFFGVHMTLEGVLRVENDLSYQRGKLRMFP